MMSEKASRKGCDAIDLSVLWPCMAQIGCTPVSDMLLEGRSAKPATEQEEGGR